MSLAYERAGSGPSLVLLHGLGHRRQGWAAVRDKLTPHRDVISVDLPGHGQSPPLRTGGHAPVEAIAEQIATLLSELGLSRPHLAGNSLGGTIALTLAAQGRAASVTALSPAGFPGHGYEFYYDKALFTFIRVAARAIRPLVPGCRPAPLAGRCCTAPWSPGRAGSPPSRPGAMRPASPRPERRCGWCSPGRRGSPRPSPMMCRSPSHGGRPIGCCLPPTPG